MKRHTEDFYGFETNEARFDRLDLNLNNFFPRHGALGVFNEREELISVYMDWKEAIGEVQRECDKNPRAMQWSMRPIPEEEIMGYLTRMGVQALDQNGRVYRSSRLGDRMFR